MSSWGGLAFQSLMIRCIVSRFNRASLRILCVLSAYSGRSSDPRSTSRVCAARTRRFLNSSSVGGLSGYRSTKRSYASAIRTWPKNGGVVPISREIASARLRKSGRSPAVVDRGAGLGAGAGVAARGAGGAAGEAGAGVAGPPPDHAATFLSVRPLTRAASSSDANSPFAARSATIFSARPRPTPGRLPSITASPVLSTRRMVGLGRIATGRGAGVAFFFVAVFFFRSSVGSGSEREAGSGRRSWPISSRRRLFVSHARTSWARRALAVRATGSPTS